MRVLIELRGIRDGRRGPSRDGDGPPAAAATAMLRSTDVVIDESYEPVELPAARPADREGPFRSLAEPLRFSDDAADVTYLVRGTISDDDAQAAAQSVMEHPDVVGVFSDPVVERCIVCPGDAAVGTDKDVARLLEVPKLAAAGLTGQGVRVAVVDSGINIAYLKSKGLPGKLAAGGSWTPANVGTTYGKHPVDHGTMCAYDVGIAAPQATLLDHALLLSGRQGTTVMAGFLSDGLLSYAKLRRVLLTVPVARRAMVITNSWGMFDPAWDFPVGHPGNYSDNARHPFNIIVASLEAAGADILFAAGNCGRDCEDGRCNFGGVRPICGANSHPKVLSVAGIDVKRRRVGYSSQGPGRLSPNKPDLAGYTHFKGSVVYDSDGGTSAACPVLAGVVAAVRTKYKATRLSPMQLRSLLFKTAADLGKVGHDYNHGWGTVDTTALLKALATVPARGRAESRAWETADRRAA